jgi:hypothetical protein
MHFGQQATKWSLPESLPNFSEPQVYPDLDQTRNEVPPVVNLEDSRGLAFGMSSPSPHRRGADPSLHKRMRVRVMIGFGPRCFRNIECMCLLNPHSSIPTNS